MEQLFYGEEGYLANKAFTEKEKEYPSPRMFWEFTEDTYRACFEEDFFTLGSRKGIFVRLESLEKNELLEEYLKHPSEGCDLFVFAGKVNRSLRVFKAFGKGATEYRRVSASALQGMVLQFLREHDAGITEDGYQAFVERTGYLQYKSKTTLWDVFGELGRLVLISKGIDRTLVEQEVRSQYADAFSLSRCFMEQDYGKLLQNIQVLSAEKGFSSIQTLSLMMRNWRCGYLKVMFGKEIPNVYVRPGMTGHDLIKGMECLAEGIRSVKQGTYSDRNALKIVALKMIAIDNLG